MVRHLIALALVATALAWHPGEAGAEAFVRVISQRASIHTGPSARYREVYVAERGDIYEVLERGTQGFWFRVKLEDGTTGWVFGELVFPFEVVEDTDVGIFRRMGRAISAAILGPSPAPNADVELSFSAGALDFEGTFIFRPAWLIDPYFSLEGFIGLSPREQEDLFLGGLGATLRLIPGAAVGPFVHVGVGAGHFRPKVDNFTEDPETLFAVNAGGGFEITFKKQITLRLDFRNWTIFDPDQASNGQEYSGGLAIFF